MTDSLRLDRALLAQGLAQSRARAQELIKSGQVTLNGAICRKPSQMVHPGARLSLSESAPGWVSRAAVKLEHGLAHFGYDPRGCCILDLGASTGGFTEVLLAGGAARVYALDVGHGQLHPRLAGHPDVVSMEGRNARHLGPGDLPPLDAIVSDVSFISLTKALPAPLAFARPGAWLIALIKPQFEVGPAKVGKGGIVKDAAARASACESIHKFLQNAGWCVQEITESPITGSDGNVEYLIGARRPGGSAIAGPNGTRAGAGAQKR